MTDVLKLTRPMMHGPAVRRLQETGDLLGVDTGGNDGVFGPKTREAVVLLRERLGLPEGEECDPALWAAMERAVAALPAAPGITDRRGLHPLPKLHGGTRSWSGITGVTLHQTGCKMSDLPKGWDRLNAHIGVTRLGEVVIVNDPAEMIWHAQGLSQATIGVEICGNYCGIEGAANTLWKGGGGPHTLNDEMLAGLDLAFAWIGARFAENGRQWTTVHAHRQSSGSRTSDPGGEIWRTVGMVWLERIGGTDGGPDWKTGSGRTIPREWNPTYPHKYWSAP